MAFDPLDWSFDAPAEKERDITIVGCRKWNRYQGSRFTDVASSVHLVGVRRFKVRNAAGPRWASLISDDH